MQMLIIVSTLNQGKKVNISISFFVNLKLKYGKALLLSKQNKTKTENIPLIQQVNGGLLFPWLAKSVIVLLHSSFYFLVYFCLFVF